MIFQMVLIEYRKSLKNSDVIVDLMKYLPFVLTGLEFQHKPEIMTALISYQELQYLETIVEITQSQIEKIKVLIQIIKHVELSILAPYFKSKLDTKKVHTIDHHPKDFIDNGSGPNFNSKSYEQSN